MAELTYRAAVARGIAQEMERDESVVLIGEDVAAAGGVFKTTEGLMAKFGPDRVLGCVVYPAAEVIEPGVVKHIEGNRFSLGEPDGSRSDRAMALSKTLMAAGLKAPVRPRLRDEIWECRFSDFSPLSARQMCCFGKWRSLVYEV